jgi:uncharacterized membrane protein
MKISDRNWLVIIACLCVVYFALRLWNLTNSCLWFDEIFGIHAAEHDWKNLFRFVAQDLIHPPFFYALLKIWISAGSENMFWLRFFPVFFSTLAIIPFILLCRQLKLSLPIIALALTFFAVNGSLIKYAQEVRMYSLLLCLGLFSLWLFVRFLNLGKGFYVLAAVNIVLVYSHYFGWLIIASEIVAVLILARERLKQILLMFVLTAAGFAPWIYEVWQAARINANLGQNIGWMTKPNFITILQFVLDLFEPIYFQNSTQEKASIYLLTVPILAIAAIAAVLYFAEWKNQNEAEKRNFYLLLIFAFIPIFLAFLVSWIAPYSVWGTRHLIITFVPAAILTAKFLFAIKIQPLKIGFISLTVLFIAIAFAIQLKTAQMKYIWCAWEDLAGNLNLSEPQKIYVFEDLTAYHFWFALRDSDKIQIIVVKNIDGLKEDAAYFLPRGFDKVQTANQFEGERFYIAYRDKNWNEFAPPLQNLKAQGYRIGKPQIYEAQGIKAFLVEVQREN